MLAKVLAVPPESHGILLAEFISGLGAAVLSAFLISHPKEWKGESPSLQKIPSTVAFSAASLMSSEEGQHRHASSHFALCTLARG